MSHVIIERGGRALVGCAFCNGTAKDPFGIMSSLSICYACLGRGESWVPKPLRECPYCQATGRSPIGARNYCAVCHGRGMVTIAEPAVACPSCGGSGRHRRTGLYFWPCRGRGLIVSRS
jgi:DnaJ-class molecular chaperone